MTRFVLVVFLAALVTIVGSSLAVAACKPNLPANQTSGNSASPANPDLPEFSNRENSPQADPRPFVRLDDLAQVFVPMSWACYTPVGACQMMAPAPVGSGCYCPLANGSVVWGTVR